jgi:hypothetical protein
MKIPMDDLHYLSELSENKDYYKKITENILTKNNSCVILISSKEQRQFHRTRD